MSIKLVLLKSGEDIVSDVKEMIADENRVIGYYLKKPCIVKMKNFSSGDSEKHTKSAKMNIILYPWMPLSKNPQVPIPSDWVVTITEPIDNLVSMYENDVLNYNKNDQSTNSDEQPNTDNED